MPEFYTQIVISMILLIQLDGLIGSAQIGKSINYLLSQIISTNKINYKSFYKNPFLIRKIYVLQVVVYLLF